MALEANNVLGSVGHQEPLKALKLQAGGDPPNPVGQESLLCSGTGPSLQCLSRIEASLCSLNVPWGHHCALGAMEPGSGPPTQGTGGRWILPLQLRP